MTMSLLMLFLLAVFRLVCDNVSTSTQALVSAPSFVMIYCSECEMPCTYNFSAHVRCPKCGEPLPPTASPVRSATPPRSPSPSRSTPPATPLRSATNVPATCRPQPTHCICPTFPPRPTLIRTAPVWTMPTSRPDSFWLFQNVKVYMAFFVISTLW
jgi:hypothetical protein